MAMSYEEYMRQVVMPMRMELSANGFTELTTEEAVVDYMENVEGTTLVVINSVCGCAAGLARPAAVQSLNNAVKPDHFVTVFAGQDREATAKMREYFGEDHVPSSPSMALLKGKEVVHFIPREEIENNSTEAILDNLTSAFNTHCSK